jgi:putative lipoic acid-binding regulatory protein
MSEAELFQFPCDFPLKVMGRTTEHFRMRVRDIVERHAGPLEESQLVTRLSADGNFLSLTFNIRAESRTQLDALYRELSAADEVLVVL